MSDTAAAALARHPGGQTVNGLDLGGLTNLTYGAIAVLCQSQQELFLNGLENVSDTAAEALSNHRGGGLGLNGISILTERAERALAQYPRLLSSTACSVFQTPLQRRWDRAAKGICT